MLTSYKETITSRVPKGSVSSPLRFLIYINDIYKGSKELSFIPFADDTNGFYSHKDIQIQNGLQTFSKHKKIKVILFKIKKKK